MQKFLKWAAIVVGSLAIVLFVAFKFMQSNTKKASPEQTVALKQGGKDVTISYCRPSKKGREIFGGLVPVSYTHLDVYKRQILMAMKVLQSTRKNSGSFTLLKLRNRVQIIWTRYL